jgi:Fic family protein
MQRIPTYIHQLEAWPTFKWDERTVMSLLAGVRHRQGRLHGRMEAIGFDLSKEAVLETLTQDVVKSSEIEGEILEVDQVRSSLAQRLGIDIGALTPADRDVDGVVEMILDATQRYQNPLTKDRLLGWHASLFPSGRSGFSKITVGAWRPESAGPMQVVSGPEGRQKVHFEAPEAPRLAAEMKAFLSWFNANSDLDPVLRAALAHLWFVTIHPFEDGNGRIARAIADLALARADGTSQRFYSMSMQIRAERKGYYDILEATQKGDLDVTPWITWFLHCLDRAFDGAEQTLSKVLSKARFWTALKTQTINDRQRKLLNLLLNGFEGKLTSGKWAKIAKTSTDTALRDITDLVERGLLIKAEGGGRSTGYILASPIWREPTTRI